LGQIDTQALLEAGKAIEGNKLELRRFYTPRLWRRVIVMAVFASPRATNWLGFYLRFIHLEHGNASHQQEFIIEVNGVK
jgi:hypothetical protein